jgi:hypothetical protein
LKTPPSADLTISHCFRLNISAAIGRDYASHYDAITFSPAFARIAAITISPLQLIFHLFSRYLRFDEFSFQLSLMPPEIRHWLPLLHFIFRF